MDITVIICTYNRCRTLAKALNSVVASILPGSVTWEVLVVDNNSSDQTREVVEEFCRGYPGRIRYFFEPQPGKSHALNAGIRQARGDILAFTDDDVIVEQTWLRNLTAALHESRWAGAGGRTLPPETFSPPGWLPFGSPHNFGSMVCAFFDLGDQPCRLDRAPYGANMAFRGAMFRKHGGFRTDLGPSPDRDIPRPNEDTEFGRRLMAAGERLRYEPSAVVHHAVPPERLNKQYVLAWCFDFGRAVIRERGRRPPVWGIPRHYLSIPKLIGTHLPLGLRWLMELNPQRRFFMKCSCWMIAGQTIEICRVARDGKSRKERGTKESLRR